jgi:carboxypeptidase C (cathepsin A)
MKKTILKAMLFFAFFAIGLQNASAQYVTSDDATILLTAEIQEAVDLIPTLNLANKETLGRYIEQKTSLFTFVKDRIAAGATVEAAVQQGADRFNHTVTTLANGSTTGKNPYVSPLHQEILDLLTL